jgi:hypothetical protein
MEPITELGPVLAPAVLAGRKTLPRRPDRIEHTTERLGLRLYMPADGDELHAISDGTPVTRLGRSIPTYDADELIWRFMPAGPLLH